MPTDVCADERAERHDMEASLPDVIERLLDEEGADTGAFGRGCHLSVDEHDQPRFTAVADLADQFAVRPCFVTEFRRVVLHRHISHRIPRGGNASPSDGRPPSGIRGGAAPLVDASSELSYT